MEIINNNTYLNIEGPIVPERDENGNIVSVTSSEHQINEVSQFVEKNSIYTYYTSSYLEQIFDFEFKEFGVSSDEKKLEDATIPAGMLLISQSEYDFLLGSNVALQIEVDQLKEATSSLQETIANLESTIEYLISLVGDGDVIINPTILTNNLNRGAVGKEYNSTLNAAGGSLPYTWTIDAGSLPENLILDSTTGIITGIPNILFDENIIFGATDSLGKSDFKSIGLKIVNQPTSSFLFISTEVIEDAIIDEFYTFQLEADNGTLPYIWTIDAGSLPENLILDETTGIISGIPVNLFNGSIGFGVTDSLGESYFKSIEFKVINSPPPSLIVSTENLPDATFDEVYTFKLEAANGIEPYTWSLISGLLPSGLSLSSSGLITGIAESFSDGAFQVEVKDSIGNSATKELRIRVG